MQIRRLTTDEIPEMVELSQLVYRACLQAGTHSADTALYFDEYMNADLLTRQAESRMLFLWGCFADGRMVGCCGMYDNGQISILYVHPQYQHRKYGRKLLMTMRCFAGAELNLNHVTVNAAPAWTGRFFERFGFADTGKEPLSSGNFLPYMQLAAPTVYVRNYPRRDLPVGVVLGMTGAAFGISVLLTILYTVIYLF